MTNAVATIVLWHGQYCNDGRERLETLLRNERTLFGLRSPRLVGRAGSWSLIADAAAYVPHPLDYVPAALNSEAARP